MKRIHFVKLLLVAVLVSGSLNAWGAEVTLSNANIVSMGDASTSYSTYTATISGYSWEAYAIKNVHSKATNTNHYLQIKKYASNTAYYIQLPTFAGTITSIKLIVSSTTQPMTGGSNSATLYFSNSKSTSATGIGVASGSGASSVTIDCSSLGLTTGYITAGAAVRIWDITVTYSSSSSGETTNYCDVSFVDNVQGTDCSSFDMTDVAENTQIVFNSISDKPQATTGTCEQTHYHFVGWIEDGETPNETGSNVIAAGTTSIKATKDVTYKAVWAQEAN